MNISFEVTINTDGSATIERTRSEPGRKWSQGFGMDIPFEYREAVARNIWPGEGAAPERVAALVSPEALASLKLIQAMAMENYSESYNATRWDVDLPAIVWREASKGDSDAMAICALAELTGVWIMDWECGEVPLADWKAQSAAPRDCVGEGG